VPVDITTRTKQSYDITIIIMCYMHYSVIYRFLLIRPDERIFEVTLITNTLCSLHTYMYKCTRTNFFEICPANE
jgi:hypothetical protein